MGAIIRIYEITHPHTIWYHIFQDAMKATNLALTLLGAGLMVAGRTAAARDTRLMLILGASGLVRSKGAGSAFPVASCSSNVMPDECTMPCSILSRSRLCGREGAAQQGMQSNRCR